jgi:hypothetical protein
MQKIPFEVFLGTVNRCCFAERCVVKKSSAIGGLKAANLGKVDLYSGVTVRVLVLRIASRNSRGLSADRCDFRWDSLRDLFFLAPLRLGVKLNLEI